MCDAHTLEAGRVGGQRPGRHLDGGAERAHTNTVNCLHANSDWDRERIYKV